MTDVEQVEDQIVLEPQQEFEEEKDENLIQWIKTRHETETKRLKNAKVLVIPMEAKNFGVVVDCETNPRKPFLINRIEIKTGFSFDQIQQIKLSPPCGCPLKPGFEYRNVLLFTDKPAPIIVPYLYPVTYTLERPNEKPFVVKNKLNEWLLINSKYERSRHKVNEYF